MIQILETILIRVKIQTRRNNLLDQTIMFVKTNLIRHQEIIIPQPFVLDLLPVRLEEVVQQIVVEREAEDQEDKKLESQLLLELAFLVNKIIRYR
jgi:hypothetical protein